jgi:hypothetical protein
MAKKKPKASNKPTGANRGAYATAIGSEKPAKGRIAALIEDPSAVCESHANFKRVVGILLETTEPIDVRLAALQTLQAASFSVVSFESCQGEYIAALRTVATDPDPELRQRVLGILAREKDGFAQKKLLDGLKNPEKALVPPEKALQLLSYDVHADAYRLAREIVEAPPNKTAKREAMRLLAADASAVSLFEKVLVDKNEDAEVRQISAAALHALAPEKLQTRARAIVLDKSDDPRIQAVSLTAMTNFGDVEAVAQDDALKERVDELSDKGSTAMKRSARQFLTKYDVKG